MPRLMSLDTPRAPLLPKDPFPPIPDNLRNELPPRCARLTRYRILDELHQWNAFAWQLAKKWSFNNERVGSVDEFYLCALEGFYAAALRFDTSRGLKFSTPAAWWVQNISQRFIESQRGICAHWRYEAQYAHLRDLADGISSLDASGPDGHTLADTIPEREQRQERQWPDDFWQRVDKCLDARWSQIVKLRYRDGLTMEAVGARLGVSKERVRQLLASARKRLRERADFRDCL